MNTTRLILLFVAALVAVTCADFVQPLSGPLAYPQHTITFDDIPAQYLPVWNYYWYTPHFGIGQAFGAVIDTSANYWNSTAPWFDSPYKPGHFHTLYDNYLDYNFNPPIKMFSAKIRATTDQVPYISVKLVNGTEIAGRAIAQFSYSDSNRYDYYGFNSSVPITNVLIRGGSVNVDDVQYTTVCPELGNDEYTYNSTTGQCVDIDECATGAYVCDPNAYCIDTPGSYTCKCKADYQGDGKTCNWFWASSDQPLANPQDTITFDNLPVGDLPYWNYLWLNNATHVGIGQNTAKIVDGVWNNWNSTAPWYNGNYGLDQPSKTPGRFYAMTSDYMDFKFDPPIRSFSVRMIATSGAPYIQLYTAAGDHRTGDAVKYRHDEVPVSQAPVSQVPVYLAPNALRPPPVPVYPYYNQYYYYTVTATFPITNVLVRNGSVNVDDFQFITVCADKTATYNYATDTCT